MKRGQIYYADLRPVIGSEQGGIRPVVIIQNDTGNLHSPTVIVAMMSTQKKANLPTHIAVCNKDKNLDLNTVIMLEQVRTIDKSRLSRFVGGLSDETMRKVDEALHISFALTLNKEERKEAEEVNELKIFQNEEFGSVRTVDIDGKTYFVANDVAKALGYVESAKAVRTHCKGASEMDIPTNGGMQKMKVIPEGDIYRLIIKSQLPSADKFECWIFDEVIPQIRKTGSYQKPLSQVEMMRLQLGMIDNHEERIVNLENNMTIDYGQQRVLEDAVNKTVIESLGGKGSNAYTEIGKKVFAECNRDLKHYFNVNARNNVQKKRFNEAVEYAKNWKPCTNTQMMIDDCNAQLNVG